jgi:hypothetical protein
VTRARERDMQGCNVTRASTPGFSLLVVSTKFDARVVGSPLLKVQ